jgi:hypothetical protein
MCAIFTERKHGQNGYRKAAMVSGSTKTRFWALRVIAKSMSQANLTENIDVLCNRQYCVYRQYC